MGFIIGLMNSPLFDLIFVTIILFIIYILSDKKVVIKNETPISDNRILPRTVRFAVCFFETEYKGYEVSGSELLNDEEVEDSLLESSAYNSDRKIIKFYEMEYPSLTVKEVEIQRKEN